AFCINIRIDLGAGNPLSCRMSFSTTLCYASRTAALLDARALQPDFHEKRPLKRRIMDTFHDNKTHKIAIVLRVTRVTGMELCVTLSDAPPEGEAFPCAREMIRQRPHENFKSNLLELRAGSIRSVGFEMGVVMTRREFHSRKSLFTPFQKLIDADGLTAMKPV